MDVYVGSEDPKNKVRLLDSNRIGKGGNGTVIGQNGLAFKILHDTSQVPQKLLDLMECLKSGKLQIPSELVMPQDFLYQRGRVVGYTMKLLPSNFVTASNLIRVPQFVKDNNVTSVMKLHFFLNLLPILDKLHPQMIFLGDLNDKNLMFLLSNEMPLFVIDGDDLSFGQYGSSGTEFYLDPLLYGKDLTKPVFSSGSDYYSMAVMLFWSLLEDHPFGGVHRKVRDLLFRIQERIPLYDPGVISSIAKPKSILNADMSELFEMYFKNDYRGKISKTILLDYIDDLETGRSKTPSTGRPKMQHSANNNFSTTQLITTTGKIMYTSFYDGVLYVVAHENRRVVLYTKEDGKASTRIDLFAVVVGTRYRILLSKDGQKLHVVTNPPHTTEIKIFSVSGNNGVVAVESDLRTQIFISSAKPIFRTSKNLLYIMQGDALSCIRIVNDKIESQALRLLRANQTWFAVDPDSTEPKAFGFYYRFSDQVFWLLKGNQFFEVLLKEIATNETHLDISVKFNKHGILVIRRTEQLGKEYLYVEVVDNEGNVVYPVNQIEANRHEYRDIHGRIFNRIHKDGKFSEMILHSTDEGVKQEIIKDGKSSFTIFDGSEAFVGQSDTLYPHAEGLIVVKEDQIILLS